MLRAARFINAFDAAGMPPRAPRGKGPGAQQVESATMKPLIGVGFVFLLTEMGLPGFIDRSCPFMGLWVSASAGRSHELCAPKFSGSARAYSARSSFRIARTALELGLRIAALEDTLKDEHSRYADHDPGLQKFAIVR